VRVLAVSDRYPPYYLGGYEIGCQAAVDGLRARGHEVHVLASRFGLAGETPAESGVGRWLHRPQDNPGLGRLALAEIADLRRLERTIREQRPDVLYAWCLAQLFPSLHARLKRSGVPLVYAIQDLWIPAHLQGQEARRAAWLRPGSNPAKHAAKRALHALFHSLDREWLRPLDVSDVDLRHVVFPSEYQRRRHQDAGLPLGDSAVIPNGVDAERLDGKPRRPGRNARLLFVGRLVAEKGAHLAVEAVAEMRRRGFPDLVLDLAGVPSYPLEYAHGLEADVARRELQSAVRFLGFVPAGALPRVYAEHDVLVFPSQHREGLPLTLIEAMASGLVVVATTTGGSAEVLQDGVNGLALPEDADGPRIADRLEELLGDPARGETLAAAGREWARRTCALPRVAESTEAYLATVAGRA